METGIYGIRHRVTGCVYIGSTRDLERRWKQHRALLNRGVHPTPRLQAAWLAHGADVFDFVVLEICAVAELTEREQWWFDSVRPHVPDVGYNELSSVRADWSNAEFRKLMTAAAVRRAGTPEGRAQIKAARANRKDYSTFGAHARSFVKDVKNQHRSWTAEDELLLLNRYGPDGAEACAAALNRSLGSVYLRASKLGLKKGEAFKKRMHEVSLAREAKRREAP